MSNLPLHEIEHGNLLAQQCAKPAVITEFLRFFPPHLVGQYGSAAIGQTSRHDSLSVTGVAATQSRQPETALYGSAHLYGTRTPWGTPLQKYNSAS